MLKVQNVIHFLMNTLKKERKKKTLSLVRELKFHYYEMPWGMVRKKTIVCVNEKCLQDLNLKLLRKKISWSIDVPSSLGDIASCQLLKIV